MAAMEWQWLSLCAGCFPGNSPVDEPAAGAGEKICSEPQNIPMSCAGRHDTLLLGCLRPPADIYIGMKLRPSASELCRWLGATYGLLAARRRCS